MITADAAVSGRMSFIEKEEYEKINAEGDVTIQQIDFISADLGKVEISKASMAFTPQYLNLETFDARLGKSDIHLDGKLQNFIAYALKGQTVKGVLNVSSQYIDAAQFMTEEKVEGPATDTGAVQEEKMSVIIVPKNIDFTLNTNIRKVSLGKIDFTDM